MIIQIVGHRPKVDFVAKDGTHVEGQKYYFLMRDDNVEGYMPDSIFYRKDVTPPPYRVGYKYEVEYNRWGKMSFVREVSD